jgi:hypothetical protein
MTVLQAIHTNTNGSGTTVPLACDLEGRLILAPGSVSLGAVSLPAPQITVSPTPIQVNPTPITVNPPQVTVPIPQVTVQPTLPAMLVLDQVVGALAVNTAKNSDVLDLGDAPRHSLILARKTGVASNNEQLDVFSSNDAANVNSWVLCPNVGGHNVLASVKYATGQAVLVQQARPMGRYVRAVYRSGAAAHTAANPLLLSLVALAGC